MRMTGRGVGLAAATLMLICRPGSSQAEDPKKPVAASISAADADFFESKIRPILVEHCQSCHGPDKQKGNLRLDALPLAMKGGDNGPALVPGHPETSLLIQAVEYGDELQMPPKAPLPKKEVKALTEWVKRGAPWPAPKLAVAPLPTGPDWTARLKEGRKFWAFQPIQNPPLPSVRDLSWPRNGVDHFILAKLEAKQLTPSKPADRRTLIRRAYFDVIGLPPSPAAVEAFVNDPAPDAFDRVVEQLLASPHYGERWGRHWLDIARYGEDQAHSFQPRLYPEGFRYRDWVTQALNTDLPYNKFLLDQIAGDLTDEPGKTERLPALGFFALGPVYYGDAKRHDQVDDRIDTLTRGVLGLTVSCARCHDHKYDPIPTTDYYALAGIFHSTDYQEAPLAPKPVVEAYNKAQAVVDAKTKAIDAFLKKNADAVAQARAGEVARYVLAAWKLRNRQAAKPETKPGEVAKSEGLDPQLLDRWSKYLADESMLKNRPALSAWKSLVGGQKPSAKLLDDPKAVAEAKKVAESVQSALRDVMTRKSGMARLEPADTSKPKGTASDVSPKVQPRPLTESDTKFYEDFLGKTGLFLVPKNQMETVLKDDAKKQLQEMKADLKKTKDSLPPKYPITHTLTEASSPVNMPVLIRGNPATTGPVVPRHFLSVLGGDQTTFKKGSGRLELAKAIVDPSNPLTPRVFVNRVWQHYFGRGLVGTPSNFGALGERPTHPELLDHLAWRFVHEGWSIKNLHRMILLSATYQQSSALNPKAAQVDEANTLLWRMNRKRLEIEPWRDAMLAVSGRLDTKMGGTSGSVDTPENVRRTYYARISRHDLSPLLRMFDFPEPNITSAERTKTTVALQQLMVLNDELLVRSAKSLAARLNKARPDDASRVDRAYALLFGRSPTARERSISLAYLSVQDEATSASKNDLSRWERYAQALLASNEFLFVD